MKNDLMKYPSLFICSLFVFLAFGACNKNKLSENSAPVETRPPHTDYQPAFANQTRARGMKTKAKIQVKVFNSQLQQPWAMALLPEGDWLITQKSGSMVIIDYKGEIKHTISGLPEVYNQEQGGLLGVAVDPQFNRTRMVYWSYVYKANDTIKQAIAKGRLSEDLKFLTDIQTIYEIEPGSKSTKHFGGRLIFDRNGHLFVTTGERFDMETRHLAQDKTNALGKILKITRNGRPAPGNPFLNDSTAIPELYSYGHRNVQGLAFDYKRRTIWQSEMGPMGGDELNKIEAGANYGWPVISYGLEYNGDEVGEGITKFPGMEQPVYYWDPAVAPGAMLVYSGEHFTEWEDNLLIACLGGKHIIRLRITDGRVDGEERLLEEEGQRFRDMGVGNNGKIYLITDEGRFYQISKKSLL